MKHKLLSGCFFTIVLAFVVCLFMPLAAHATPDMSVDGTCSGCHPEMVDPTPPGNGAAEIPEPAETVAAPPAAAGEGTFSGRAVGFGGRVEVTISVEDGAISDVTIAGAAETAGIGSNAIDRLPERIIETQSWDVDVVAGATVTSDAIREATQIAMAEAGLIEPVATPTPAPIPTPAAPAVPAGAEYFTASARGFGGEVEVSLGVADGEIVDVKITGAAETAGIGSNAVDGMPERILSAQSWDVDAVAGATITSNAIRDASMTAMTEAGLLSEAASPEPEQTAEPTVEPTVEPTPEPTPEPSQTQSGIGPVIGIAALAIVLGSTAFYLARRKK